MAEQTFGATFMGLKRNRVLVVVPEPGEHSPTERQGQQRYQLAEPLSVAEVGRFEVKSSGFERGKQRLNAPSQTVIRQCALRSWPVAKIRSSPSSSRVATT